MTIHVSEMHCGRSMRKANNCILLKCLGFPDYRMIVVAPAISGEADMRTNETNRKQV
jgi:hypothetical protein